MRRKINKRIPVVTSDGGLLKNVKAMMRNNIKISREREGWPWEKGELRRVPWILGTMRLRFLFIIHWYSYSYYCSILVWHLLSQKQKLLFSTTQLSSFSFSFSLLPHVPSLFPSFLLILYFLTFLLRVTRLVNQSILFILFLNYYELKRDDKHGWAQAPFLIKKKNGNYEFI